MLREYSPGERVTSIAVQDLGVGTVVVPSTTHLIVQWDDGSWSKERYQDVIFVGADKDAPLPVPHEGGTHIPLRGTNTEDTEYRLDLAPQHKFDDSMSDAFRPPPQPFSVSSLNPAIFEAPTGWTKHYIPPKFGYNIEDLADPDPARRRKMQEKGVVAQHTMRAEIINDEQWWIDKGFTPPPTALLRQNLLEDELQSALNRWLLYNQGSKLARRV